MTINFAKPIVVPAILALACSTCLTGVGLAQDAFPSKPINMIVGFAPGGFADASSRAVAEHMSSVLGQPVVVENRAGAASNIAASYVASTPADGYTILATTTSIAVNATLYPDLDYVLFEDLVPVAVAVQAPETFSVHPAQPHTLAEFLEAAKASGGKTFGTAGVGSGSHLTFADFFDNVAQAPVTHVPFQGAGPANQAVMGGHTDGFAGTASGPVVGLIEAGSIVCLGVAAAERYPALPDCPTLEEQGFPGHYGASWVSFWVPAGTPDDVIQALNEAVRSIDENPTMAEALAQNGVIMDLDVAQTEEFVRSEVDVWGGRVTASGATVE